MKKYLNLLISVVLFSCMWGQSAELSLTNLDEAAGTVDVYMSNDTPVGGFQFNIEGISNFSASD